MRCGNCGHNNESGSKFCEKCGQSLAKPKKEEFIPLPLPPKSPAKNKSLRYVLLALLVLALAGGAGFWYYNERAPKDNYEALIEQLEAIKQSADANAFYDLLTIDDRTDKTEHLAFWTKQDIASLATQSQAALDTLYNEGVAQKALANTPLEAKVVDGVYMLVPIATEITATTNVSPVTLVQKDQTITVTPNAAAVVGTYLPGEYSYSVTWDAPSGKVEEARTFTTADGMASASFLYYPTTLGGADGRAVTYKINEQPLAAEAIRNNELWLPKQQTATIQASFTEGGKTYTSSPVKVEEGVGYVEFNYPGYYNAADVEREVGYVVDAYLRAYEAGDVNGIGAVISSSSAFYTSQRNYLANLNRQGIDVSLLYYDIQSVQHVQGETYNVRVGESFSVKEPNKARKTVNQTVTYAITNYSGSYYITGYTLH